MENHKRRKQLGSRKRAFYAPFDAPPPCTKEEATELLARIRLGDKAARARLSEGHIALAFDRVSRALNGHVADRWAKPGNPDALADDLVSAALLGLTKACAKIEVIEHDNVAGYISAFVEGAILGELTARQRARRRNVSQLLVFDDDDDESLGIESGELAPDERVELRDAIDRIGSAFPPDWQIGELLLNWARGSTVRELAEGYELPKSTVSYRLKRAIALLKEIWE